MGEERAFLHHQADVAAVRGDAGGGVGDVLAVERDLAGVGSLEAGDQAQQRRLARA